jgi:alpha-D-ribose 1-methylphosphonate 5-triphosphate synthase subunit PhnL
MQLLHINDLHKSFTLHGADGRTISALRGVELTVAEQEHVALAGLSGAGKSSLLKCIHRTYVTDRGSIAYRQADGSLVDLATLGDGDMAELRARDIGYVSQFLRAEPRRGVLDVVTRAAVRMGAPPDEARDRAVTVLRQVRIAESLWRTYPTLLSGGEKQRVNLAAGIVVAPRLLLLDEPVSALDPTNREGVLSVIAELTERGATVVSVLHDLDAIRFLADRVVILHHGRAIDNGAPDQILDQLSTDLEPA